MSFWFREIVGRQKRREMRGKKAFKEKDILCVKSSLQNVFGNK